MSKYVIGKSSPKAQVWLQRMVRFWLASGMIAMPWVGSASEIIRTDIPGDSISGTGVHNIYVGKDVGNGVGASTFSKFNITQGDIANMHFRTSATSTTNFNTLLNFVDSRIDINGTVNAIRDGGIGGHLYFLSPNGMAVGASGVINAGALTVLTPTTDWWSKRSEENKFALGQFNKDGSNDLTAVTNMLVPINALGTIAVQGRINVTNNMYLKAGTINISRDTSNSENDAAVLTSGVVDFSDVVKLSESQRITANITKLTAARDANSGDIIIAAEANLAENFKDVDFKGITKEEISGGDFSKVAQKTKDFITNCMEFASTAENKFLGYKVNAVVNITGGSNITAAKNLKVSATALNSANYSEYSKVVAGGGSATVKSVNGETVDASKFAEQYQNAVADGFAFGSRTKVNAVVNITNEGAATGKATTLTGLHTDVKAYALNTYETNNNVVAGQKEKDPAKDKEGTILPKISWEDVNSLFEGLDVVYGDLTSNAIVTVGENAVVVAKGADTSGTEPVLQILAQADTKLILGVKNTEPKEGDSFSSLPGMGVIVGLTNNNALVNMGGILKTESGSGNVKIDASSNMETSAKANMGFVSKDDKGALDFGVVVQYGYNNAVVNLQETADLKNNIMGNVTVEALSNNKLASENLVQAKADENAVIFAISVTDYNSNAVVNVNSDIKANNITINAKSIYTDNSFNVDTTQEHKANDNTKKTQEKETTSAENEKYKGKVKSFLVKGFEKLQNTSIGSYLDSLKEKLEAGISFGYFAESNITDITINNVTLDAKEALGVYALSEVQDIVAKVNGTNSNKQDESSESSKQYLANGAVLISDFRNDSDVTVVGGTDGKHAVLQAAGSDKNVELKAEAIVEYDRVNRMVKELTKFTDIWKKCINDLVGPSYKEEDKKKLEAAYADFEQKIKALKAEMYDESGNLKEKYSNSSDGYASTVALIEKFTKDPSLDKFTTLLDGREYKYVDAEGKEQSIVIRDQVLLSRLKKSFAEGVVAFCQLKGLVGAAKEFANPENYLNFYVGNSITTEQASKSANYAASVTVNYNAFTDNAKVNIGRNAVIKSTGGDVNLDTLAKSADVALTGKLASVGGAQKGVIGIAVGVNNINNNSLITLAEGASVTAYNNVSLHGDNKTVHIGIGEQYGKGSDVGGAGVGVVLLVEGDSNTLVTVDDEAKIDAGTSGEADKGVITLKADNVTNGVVVAGGLASGGKAGMALAFGMLDISRQTFASVVDNDDVLSMGDYADDDSDLIRIKKILKKNNSKADFYGTDNVVVDGAITGIDLTNLAISGGDLVNIVADLGQAGNGTKAEELAGKVSGNVVGVLNKVKDKIANSKVGKLGFVKKLLNSDSAVKGKGESGTTSDSTTDSDNNGQDDDVDSAQEAAQSEPSLMALPPMVGAEPQVNSEPEDRAGEGNNPDSNQDNASVIAGDDSSEAVTQPTFSLAGTGSVGVNKVVARTGALLDGATISLKHVMGGTVTNIANDSGTIVAVAGGISISNREDSGEQQVEGSKSIAAAAGAAVNLITSTNCAQISNNNIIKAKIIDNEAQRAGALAVAAAAVDVAEKSVESGSSTAAGGSVSVNIGNYSTNAVMESNTVNDDNPGYKTNLTNKALDKDLQVTGALNTNIAIGGKRGISVGGVVSWGILNNNVKAVMSNTLNNGSYKYMGAVENTAVSDLTQIQAAIGFGLSKSKGTGLSVEGSVVVGQTTNDIVADMRGITLDADSLCSKAYDTKLEKNSNVDSLAAIGFDTSGSGYIATAGEETLGSGKTYEDKGNTMVSAAVQVTAVIGSGDSSNVAVGAAVAVNTLDNQYTATIAGSTINAKNIQNMAENSSLNVGVAAGGNGTGKGFAGSGSAVAGVYNDQVNAAITGSTLKADTVSIDAQTKNKAVNVAGTVTLSTKSIAAGLDITYNYYGTTTSALLQNTTVSGLTDNVDTDLNVKAKNAADMYAVAVAVEAAGGAAAASGSVAINRGYNDVSATVERETTDANSILSLSDFTVTSDDATNLTAAAGGAQIAAGSSSKAAVGGAVALNALGTGKKVDAGGNLISDNKVQLNQAKVIGYDVTKLTGTMDVAATDTAKITTISFGFGIAGLDDYVAFFGTDATTLLDKDTNAKVLNVNINEDGNNQGELVVQASTDNEIKSHSIVCELSGGKACVGIGLSQNLLNADTGVTVAGGTYKLNDILAQANSNQNLSNYTIGLAAGLANATVGGSVVVNTMDNDTKATVGYLDEAKVTTIDTTGSVGVVSNSKENYENYSGQVDVSITKNAVGGGAAVIVNEITGDTIALAQNAEITTGIFGTGVILHDRITDKDTTHKGLVVGTDALHTIRNTPFSGGLTLSVGKSSFGLGLDAVVSVNSIKGFTDALVKAVNLNEIKTSSIDNDNNLTVLATDKVDSKTIAANAVGGATFGPGISVNTTVGAGVSTETIDRTVEAKVIGNTERKKINADKVNVWADSLMALDISNTAVSVSLTVGETAIDVDLNAGVTYVNLAGRTHATVSGVETYNNEISLLANHKEDITLTGTGATVAIAIPTAPDKPIGVALAVGVGVECENNTTETIALLDESKVYHYSDATAVDEIKAVNTSHIKNQVVNAAAGISIIGVGIGILVADNNMQQVVQAKVNNSTIGTENKRSKYVYVRSDNKVDMTNNNYNVAVGTAGVGVLTGLNTLDASTATDVYGSTFYVSRNIDVEATEKLVMNGEAVGVSLGAVAVGVSTLHNYVQTAVTDEDYGYWTDTSVSRDKVSKNEYSAQKVDNMRKTQQNDANRVLEVVQSDTNIATAKESFTGAKDGTMNVKPLSRAFDANNTGTKVNIVDSNFYAGGNIQILAMDTTNIQSLLGGGSLGIASVQVQTNRQRVTGNVKTNVTGGKWVADGDIYIQSQLDGELQNETIQAGCGGISVGVTIAEITKDGITGITLDHINMIAGRVMSVEVKDTLEMNLYAGVSNVSLIGANAASYHATDKGTTAVNMFNTSGSSIINAPTITIDSIAIPSISSDFLAVAVSLVEGCGTVVTTAANNHVMVNVADGYSLLGDNIRVNSSVHSDDGGYAIDNQITGIAVGGVAVHVNKGIVKTDVVSSTIVGNIQLKTVEEDGVTVGKSKVTITADESLNINDSVKGVTVGLAVASGSNYAIAELKSTVTATVNAGTGTNGLYADTLTITANSGDELHSKANGDGGGVIGISPEAARVNTSIDGITTTTLTGDFVTENTMTVGSVHRDTLQILANAVNAELAGGSGTKNIIDHIVENTTTNINDAKVISLSNLSVTAHINEDINSGEDDYAVQGNGYGGIDISVAEINNKNMNLNTKVNVDSSEIYGSGLVDIEAYTNNNIFLSNWVVSVGVLSASAMANTVSNITVTDEVNITDSKNTGTEIRSNNVNADLNIAASDHSVVFIRSYSEATSGVVGGVIPTATNNLTRNNKINVFNGTSEHKTILHSNRDLNLYTDKRTDGSLGYMDISTEAEFYNGNILPAPSGSPIPVVVIPLVNIDIEQNNQITLYAGTDSRGIRHVNLYADDGRESVQKVVKSHYLYSNSDNGSFYVSTSTGNLKDAGIDRNNYVLVDGSVTAGVANNLKVVIGSEENNLVILDEDALALVKNANNGKGVYGSADKANFVKYLDAESEATAEVLGITLDDFILGTESYSESITKRYEEVNALMSAYAKDGDVYNNLLVEANRLKGIIDKLGLSGNSGSSQTTYTGINPDKVDYIEIPDLVASGGNVVVNTQNFYGTGSVTAKGNSEISVTNYTNLLLLTNSMLVQEPGGIINYNSIDLNPEDISAGDTPLERMQNQIKGINEDHSKMVDSVSAAAGTSANIKVEGLYDGAQIAFNGKNYLKDNQGNKITYDSENPMKDQSGNVIAHDEYYYEDIAGSYKPMADVQLAGNLNSLKGQVYVHSRYNNITIAGKSLDDNVLVSGKVVTIKADAGNVTQGFTEGIVNIGGDVRKQYLEWYNNIKDSPAEQGGTKNVKGTVDANTKIETKTIEDGSAAPDSETAPGGSWIQGGEIYINAVDINVNGVIQSGYDTYIADLTVADQAEIDRIISAWTAGGEKKVTDAVVKNSGNVYLVKKGGAYWSSDKQCYVFRVNVYYNPCTEELLTDNVDVSGGKVYLAGRISSTGDGRVLCLDGAYDITINNALDYDLRVGTLAVNDTKGLISITDTGTGVVTEITSSGTTTRWLDTTKSGTPEADSHITKDSNITYTYTPDSNIRYNWVTGYSNISYQKYYYEYMAKWWGAADSKLKSSGELDSWIDNKVAKADGPYVSGATVDRDNGVYITTDTGISDAIGVYFKHTWTESTEAHTHQLGQPEHWSTGFFGCHKWTRYNFQRETGNNYSDYASVKGSNPITMSFIGKKAEDSKVTVNTTQNLYITNQIGNSQLYEVKDGDFVTGYIQKGTVDLKSANASVIQAGGSLYGADVLLSAGVDLEDITVTAGESLNLTGMLTGTGTAEISVVAAYGGGNGNVVLNNLGGTDAAYVSLSVAGSIIQNTDSNLVQAKRIDLAADGSVSGRNNTALYLIAGQNDNADTTDPLKASVNIVSAKGNISIQQNQGDLRVGSIYAKDGDVVVNVPYGSIVDALPYADTGDQGTEAELIQKWISMGLIKDDDGQTTSQIQAKKLTFKNGAKVYDSYVADINKQYDDYLVIKHDKTYVDLRTEQTLTDDEKAEYDDLVVKGATRSQAEQTRYEELRDAGKLNAEQTSRYNDLIIDKYNLEILQKKVGGRETLTEAEKTQYDNLSKYSFEYTDANKAVYEDSTSGTVTVKGYSTKFAGYNSADAYLTADPEGKIANVKMDADQIKAAGDYTVWDRNALLYELQDSLINATTGVESSSKTPNIYANNITLNVKNNVGLNSPNVIRVNLAGDFTVDELKTLAAADPSTVKFYKDAKGKVSYAEVREKMALGLHQQNGKTGTIVVNTFSEVKNDVFLETRKDAKLPDNTYLDLTIEAINAAEGKGDVSIYALGSILGTDSFRLSADDLVIAAGEIGGIGYGNIGSATNSFKVELNGDLRATATGNIYISGSDKGLNIYSMAAGKAGEPYSPDSGNIYLVAVGNICSAYDIGTDVQGYIHSENYGEISLISTTGNIGENSDNMLRIKNAALTADETTDFTGDTAKKGAVSLNAGKDIYVEGVSISAKGSDKTQAAGGTLKVAAIAAGGTDISLVVNGTLTHKDDAFSNLTEKNLSLAFTDAYTIINNIAVKNLTITSGSAIHQASDTRIQAEKSVCLESGKLPTLTYGTVAIISSPVSEIVQEGSTAAIETLKLIAIAKNGINLQGANNKAEYVLLKNDTNGITYHSDSADNTVTELYVMTNTFDQSRVDQGILQDSDYVCGDISISDSNITGELLIKSGLYDKTGNVVVDTAGAVTTEKNIQAKDGLVKISGVSSVTNNAQIEAHKVDNVDTGAGCVILESEGGFVDNSGKIDADSGIAIVAEGNINNGLLDNGGVYIKNSKTGDIFIHSNKGTIINTALLQNGGDEYIGSGEVRLVTFNKDTDVSHIVDGEAKSYGDVINSGNIVNYKGMVSIAGLNISNVGSIFAGEEVVIAAIADLNNGYVELAESGDSQNVILGTNGVTIFAGSDVNNNSIIAANTGSVALFRDPAVVKLIIPELDSPASTTGHVQNNGDIYVVEQGDVVLYSNEGLENNGNINVKRGQVTIYGRGLLNTGDIYSVNNGSISIIQSDTSGITTENILINTGEIFSLGGGEVLIKAKDSLENYGDIYTDDANGDGKISLISETGNLYNTDDFAVDTGKYYKITGKEWTGGVLNANGDIELSALQGEIKNNKALIATGDVTIRARAKIYIEDAAYKSDEELLAATGKTFVKGILAGGKVTIEGTSIYNSMSVRAGTGIDLKATAEMDGSNVKVDTGVIIIHGNNGQFYTDTGDVNIVADGYTVQENYSNSELQKLKDPAQRVITEKFSIRNLGNNDLITKAGDIHLEGTYSVENVGNIEAKKTTGLNGNVYLQAINGTVYNYETSSENELLFSHETRTATQVATSDYYTTAATSTSTVAPHSIIADGNINWLAQNIYNVAGQYSAGELVMTVTEENMHNVEKVVARGDVTINAPNSISEVVFGSSISSDAGSIKFNVGGNLTFSGGASIDAAKDIILDVGNNISSTIKLEAGEDVNVYSREGTITLKEGVNSDTGLVRIYSQMSTGSNGTNTVHIIGPVTAQEGSIDISANAGDVEVDIVTAKELAGVGTMKGDTKINRIISGKKVSVYSEDKNADLTINEMKATDELILVSNSINGSRQLDMSKFVNDNDGYKLYLLGVGTGEDGILMGDYTLDYTKVHCNVDIGMISGKTVQIIAETPIKIEHLNVGNIAEIIANGTKTDVYGVMHDYDEEAKVIYYAPGNSAVGIDLHKVYFDDPLNKQPFIDQLMEDTIQFIKGVGVAGDGCGQGMYLEIRTATEQTGNGLLLRNYYGQITNDRRYSLEQWMQHLLDYKASDGYNEYFNKGIEIFQRYNLMEIPDVTVNQPVDLKDGGFEIEGTGTDKDGKKVVKKVKYEF